MCYPAEAIDSKVTELYADFLPERVFDAHMHIYCRDTIPNFYGSRGVFCRETVTPEHYRQDAAPFLPGVVAVQMNMMPMPDPALTDLRTAFAAKQMTA